MIPSKLFSTKSWTQFSLSNIWNFDETAHKIKYCKAFLYGLRGATKNNAESNGLEEHVTVRAFANVAGCFLDPILLFTGAESNKVSVQKMVQEAGFDNALVLMKRDNASMDDKIFSVIGLVCKLLERAWIYWQTYPAH
jgi:hypothetical protein